MTKYISATDQAKMIRQALKEAFGKQVKFSVRCSRGSAINIKWSDGPTKAQVEKITNAFEGGYFDGMDDYRGGYVYEIDGEKVRFSADFIFTDRSLSDEFLAQCAAEIEQMTPQQYCDVWNNSQYAWDKQEMNRLEADGKRDSDEYRALYTKMHACNRGSEQNPTPTAEKIVLVDKY